MVQQANIVIISKNLNKIEDLEKHKNCKLVIRKINKDNHGVFALCQIDKNIILDVYHGKILEKDEIEDRCNSGYVLQMNLDEKSSVFICAYGDDGSWTRFVNTGENPNTIFCT